MEKYYLFGIAAAFIVFAVILLLFGIGKSSTINTKTPLQAYSIANSSLKSAVYNDILGLQTYQNAIPNGKELLYNVNYSLSTSTSLSNGSGSNSTENARGYIQLIHGINGNSEAFSNFTASIPVSAGINYNVTSLSYVFSIANDTYLCSGSSATAGKVSCISLNESMENISSALLNSLNMSSVSLLEAYNTTYKGYPCLFTLSSFSVGINSSNSPLIAGKVGKEELSGLLTSCVYKKYNITVLTSLAAGISISMKLNGTSLNSTSFISYNESLSKISSFNSGITENGLPNKTV
ncbi:MAG: hypothetical protein OH338_01275 [Candidatus Parvarchaeota archaeon]|nr:hypothetical protein [Candidatus Parvarchaeota archaeon]MCW1294603.1 hypothetical protein [Candidatus Parvarchaeum tengchongense]MCW1295705.1 hypothetical protein [Candidatus Parvarchaeum tengchongense]MCW1298746.1 hypothetical protein [Candidatus Parvarchaeum tengchongense]MCW1312046.1 hypothetical protein [Candidatus Parvarchaeum tengchongense]